MASGFHASTISFTSPASARERPRLTSGTGVTSRLPGAAARVPPGLPPLVAATRPSAHSSSTTLRSASAGAAPTDADLSVVEELCAEVRVAATSGGRPGGTRAAAPGRRLVTPVPLVSRGRSRALAGLVKEIVDAWKPDAMVAGTLYAAHYRVP